MDDVEKESALFSLDRHKQRSQVKRTRPRDGRCLERQQVDIDLQDITSGEEDHKITTSLSTEKWPENRHENLPEDWPLL